MSHPYWRLDLHVTEACNLACPYCYAREREGAHLSTEDARRAMDWLLDGDGPKVHITFWGGEPLVRLEALEEIADEARSRAKRAGKRLSLSMPTNATLLDDRALSWIARHGVKTFLSIDGDAVTQAGRPTAGGKSSHDMAAAGLRRALGYGLARPPAVRMTVTPDSAARLADNVAYFASEGVSELLIYPAIDMAWSARALADFARGQRALGALLVECLEASPPGEVIKLRPWRSILAGLYRVATGERAATRKTSGALSHCGVGNELVALSVDGTFTPCHRFAFYQRGRREPFVLGDLSGGVDSSRTAPFGALQVEQLRPQEPLPGARGPRCVDCSLYQLCTFRCLAINYATTGELTEVPSQACALVAAQVEACREVVVALDAGPALALYLDLPVATALRAAARGLGRRAWQRYQRRRDR